MQRTPGSVVLMGPIVTVTQTGVYAFITKHVACLSV